jgi:type IX secretion system PorP/SprF family membrane protein
MFKNILFVACLGMFVQIRAQYAHNYSLFYQTHGLINPASIASSFEDFGFSTGFKLQNPPMSGTKIRTNSLLAEFKISDGPMSKNNFGIGVTIINEGMGESKLMHTEVNLPINYSIQMDQFSKLTIGATAGMILVGYDPTLPSWESNWTGWNYNGTVGDPIYINDNLSISSNAAFNVNSGVLYQYSTRNRSRFFGGAAINHINKPRFSFTETGGRMYNQIVFHGGADLTTRRKDLRVQPQFLAFKNGPSSNIIAGVMFENILKNGSDITNILKSTTINYGAFYRWKDAVTLNFNYKISNFRFGLAADISVSRLSTANKGFGSIELFFKSTHLYSKKKTKLS